MDEVEEFCSDCLNCAFCSDEDDIETYFSENQYDNYYIDYSEKVKADKILSVSSRSFNNLSYSLHSCAI